ncbi:MAG TPA: hypothetical protein VJ826_03315, partial [Candidatus Polarisedimenticolaceae bacterium]|nr:hypothetical protein [Candidatus Polarisedimenticolaceae bacterium]
MSAVEDALLGAAVADLSSWAVLRGTGPAFLPLLHRLSTGEVEKLAPGEGRPTVVTTPKGRILARLTVLHFGDAGIFVLAGPGTGARVISHLTKYALGEDIGLSDVTSSTKVLAVVGPRWTEAAEAMGVPGLASYATATIPDGTRVARTNGFDDEGLLILSDSTSRDLPRLTAEDF